MNQWDRGENDKHPYPHGRDRESEPWDTFGVFPLLQPRDDFSHPAYARGEGARSHGVSSLVMLAIAIGGQQLGRYHRDHLVVGIAAPQRGPGSLPKILVTRSSGYGLSARSSVGFRGYHVGLALPVVGLDVVTSPSPVVVPWPA